MRDWFKKVVAAFRRFMQDNASAHARSRTHGCCSSPPPGAGRTGTQHK